MATNRFLKLPGEIRNLIYSFALYPDLEYIPVINCHWPEFLGGNVLHSPLFRVSRQTRAEALSYLCATKHFGIVSIANAIVFLETISSAIGDLKVLTFVQHSHELALASTDRVDQFLVLLKKAKSLENLYIKGHTNSIFPGEEIRVKMFLDCVAELAHSGLKVHHSHEV